MRSPCQSPSRPIAIPKIPISPPDPQRINQTRLRQRAVKPDSYLIAATMDIKLERLAANGTFSEVTLPADGGFQLGDKTVFRVSNEASGIIAIYRVLGE